MMNLTVYGRTDVGLVRAQNEDAFVVADLTRGALVEGRLALGARGALLAVSDGMGGHQAGEVASALVLRSLLGSLSARASESPEGALQAAVECANRDVWQAAKAPGKDGMGATLTALLIEVVDDAWVQIAEVGDSRAYLLRAGQLVQLTHDQSYVQVMVDAGVMTPEEAEHAPMKNVILQAMGQRPAVTVALGRLALRQRDCLILCSDGLSNKVSPDELRDTILGSPRLDLACDALVELAKRHGGEDNITVVLAGVSGPVLPALVAGEDPASTLEVFGAFAAPPPAALPPAPLPPGAPTS